MIEELKVVISAEIEQLQSGVNEAKSALSTFKSELNKNGVDVGKAWNTMGEGAVNASKKIIGGVAGVATALVGVSASTEEYRENQAKLATAFETAGASAEVATGTYNDLYRVLGDGGQATEAAGHLAKLTTEEKALNEWTTICQGVYATFGDSLPIEGLTEAANETAKVGTVTGGLADALNWAGISEDEFNEKLAACNDEAEREKLIRKTLIGVYDDAAATYETNNAAVLEQNEAQAKLQATLADVGAAVAPIVTAFTSFATDALAVVTPYIQELAAKYMPELKEMLKGVGDFLKPIAEFIMNHLPAIATIAGIILGIAAAYTVINGAITAYNTIKTAFTTITTIATAAQTAFAAANTAALAPILAVVAAIAAVVAIIVLCVKHWDEIKEKVTEVWNNIKEKTTEAIENVKAKFTEMKENAQAKIEEMKEKISEKVDAIKASVSEKFNAVKEVMSTTMNAAKETVTEKLNNMRNAYNEHGGGIKGIASAAMEGIKGYYTAGYTFIDNLTGGRLTDIANTMKSKMNSAKEAVSNVLTGIKDKFSTILNSAKDLVKGIIDKIKGFFNFTVKMPHIPLPHFGISPQGWKVGDLLQGSIPKLSISWYAQGGVFDKPTLFNYGNGALGGLGENGAEAVVPLENNLGWLDKLATMLGDKIGAEKPVVLNVDGKTFAETSINTINNLTKQTGSLQLIVV